MNGNHARIAAVAVLGLALGSAQAAELRVEIQGLEPDRGELLVALYDSERTFNARQGAVESIRKLVQGDAVEVTFNGLPAGDYAIATFQDLNGNGELDTNLLGIPQEPYGFSRDAMGSMGPPDFNNAAFAVDGDATRITIQLNGAQSWIAGIFFA